MVYGIVLPTLHGFTGTGPALAKFMAFVHHSYGILLITSYYILVEFGWWFQTCFLYWWLTSVPAMISPYNPQCAWNSTQKFLRVRPIFIAVDLKSSTGVYGEVYPQWWGFDAAVWRKGLIEGCQSGHWQNGSRHRNFAHRSQHSMATTRSIWDGPGGWFLFYLLCLGFFRGLSWIIRIHDLRIPINETSFCRVYICGERCWHHGQLLAPLTVDPGALLFEFALSPALRHCCRTGAAAVGQWFMLGRNLLPSKVDHIIPSP